MFAFIFFYICDAPCFSQTLNLNSWCSLDDDHSIYVENVFGRRKMALNTGSPTTGMRGEIQKQWSKFTYQEVAALKNKDDLVAQVQTKYALEKVQAQKDVDAFAKGRQ